MIYGVSDVKRLDYVYIYLHKQKQFDKIFFEGIDNIIDFLYRKYPKYSNKKYKIDSILLYTGNSTVQTCLFYFDLVDGYIGYSEMHERAEEMFKKEWGYIDKIYTIKGKHAKERGYEQYVDNQCVIKAKIPYMELAIVQAIVERKEEGDWSWNKKKEVVEALVHTDDLEVHTNTGAPRFKESIEKILKEKDEPSKKKEKKKPETRDDEHSYSIDDEVEDLYQNLSKQMGIQADRIEARTIGTYTMGDPDPSTRSYSREARGGHGTGRIMTWDQRSQGYYELTDGHTPITEVIWGETHLSIGEPMSVSDIRSSMANIFPEIRLASAKQVGKKLYFYSIDDPRYSKDY